MKAPTKYDKDQIYRDIIYLSKVVTLVKELVMEHEKKLKTLIEYTQMNVDSPENSFLRKLAEDLDGLRIHYTDNIDTTPKDSF